MQALFTNLGNLAIIKESNNTLHGDYITRLYYIEKTDIIKLEHSNIHEHIDKPRVSEFRDKLNIKDLGSHFLAFTLNIEYERIKFVLVGMQSDTNLVICYGFNKDGDLITNSSKDIIESLLNDDKTCKSLDDIQLKLLDLFKSKNSINIDRNELHNPILGNKIEEPRLWGN